MAVRYYDDAVANKINSWLPKDRNRQIQVLKPDETKRLFSIEADEKNDKSVRRKGRTEGQQKNAPPDAAKSGNGSKNDGYDGKRQKFKSVWILIGFYPILNWLN